MARVLITGSTTGLGLVAARDLIDQGHAVVLHARNQQRADDVGGLLDSAAGLVVGDLSELGQIRALAAQVNATVPLDAIIHNAGIYPTGARRDTADGLPAVLTVNVLAPYLLTVLVGAPTRHVFLSSDMHPSGQASVDDLTWTRRRWDGTQAYCDSKLHVTALAMAVAGFWPGVMSNAVDPGWVPTRMGGPGAPNDLTLGARTQAWLATSDDADAHTSGGYWYHRELAQPAPAAHDAKFQDQLLEAMAWLTGEPFRHR